MSSPLSAEAQRILKNPLFHQLTQSRNRLALILTVVMLVVYYGFILLIAFDKALLGQKIGSGAISLGIPLGLGVIFTAIAVTGIYVYRANGEFDRLNDELLRGKE